MGFSPHKNTGVGYYALLLGSFSTQDPGIEPTSLTSPVLAVGFFTTSATLEAQINRQDNTFVSGEWNTSVNSKKIYKYNELGLLW